MYTPNNWKIGDTITAEKLNRLEQAVSTGGTLIIEVVGDYFNKTWQEIYDALRAGIRVVWLMVDIDTVSSQEVIGAFYDHGVYEITTITHDNYSASSASAYPTYEMPK